MSAATNSHVAKKNMHACMHDDACTAFFFHLLISLSHSFHVPLHILIETFMDSPSPEYYNDDGEEEEEEDNSGGWRHVIKPKVISLGRKLAMTTIAITATPLALPPVCILSVLSLAVSVPFGILAVSVAATEKLMSSLLPLPVLIQPKQDDDDDDEDRAGLDEVETSVSDQVLLFSFSFYFIKASTQPLRG